MTKPKIYIEGEEDTKLELWLEAHRDQLLLGFNVAFMVISVITLIILRHVVKNTQPDGVVG